MESKPPRPSLTRHIASAVPVPVWGFRLRPPSFNRLLALALQSVGLMGADDRRFLTGQVKPGMNVLDVGANQGLYSLLLARLVGRGGRVFSFEPDPILYDVFRRNIDANGATNITVFNTALSNSAGAATLYRCPFNSGDNRLARGDLSDSAEFVTVQTARLDDLLPSQRIDFAKVDVQGWERSVFEGMGETFSRNPDMHVLFEFWPKGLRLAGTEPESLLALLRRSGFSIYELDGHRVKPAPVAEGFADSIRGARYTNLLAAPERWSGERLTTA
jgi:FkbM family methyltransferase